MTPATVPTARAKVRRQGKWESIDAKELVPGDIISIKLGDVVPADAKLIGGEELKVGTKSD